MCHYWLNSHLRRSSLMTPNSFDHLCEYLTCQVQSQKEKENMAIVLVVTKILPHSCLWWDPQNCWQKKMIQLLYSSILSNCNKNFPCGSSTLRGQNSWWPSRPKHVSKMAKIPMAIFFSSHLVQIWLKVTSVFSDNCSKFEFSRQHFSNDVVELMDQC